MTASWFESPTLTGDRVRLEPLGVAHTDALLAAADDPAIFRWTASPITDREQAQKYIAAATDDPNRIAFAQVNIVTNAVVGTTSMYQIDPVNRSLAIGYTWLSAIGSGNRDQSRIEAAPASSRLRPARSRTRRVAHGRVQRTVQGPRSQSSAPSSRACCASTDAVSTAVGVQQRCSR